MAGEPGARDVAPPADSSPAREQGDVQDRSSYVFANAWPRARRRLRLLEQAYDESTVRRLTSLRVGAGWSCLEVGAGAGSIARWPCSRVAGTGRVVAVDLDTRFLDEVEAGNLDVRRLDVATAELPPDEFDLVHARAVLMFLPGRDDILRRLVGCLRPGGWLLVEEADDYPVATSSTESFSLAWHAVFDGLGATGAGPVLDWARHLPVLLDDLGLVDVDAEVEVRMFRRAPGRVDAAQLSSGPRNRVAAGATTGSRRACNGGPREAPLLVHDAGPGGRLGSSRRGSTRIGRGSADDDVDVSRVQRRESIRDPLLRLLRIQGRPHLVAGRRSGGSLRPCAAPLLS